MAVTPRRKAELERRRELLLKKRALLEERDSLSQDGATEDGPISDQAQAGLEAFGQTATLGYLPQLQAKAAELILGDDYLEARDENIARQKTQAEEFPKTVIAGKAAGIVPMAVAGPAATGARMGAAIGAAEGLAYNPGDKEGVVDPLQLKERGQNAVPSVFLGALGGAAGKYLGRAVDTRKATRLLKDPEKFQETAGKELGGAVKSLNENYIAPRGEKVKSLLEGHSIEVNPDIIERAGFEKLANRMKTMPDPSNPASRVARVAPEGMPLRREISGERALRLRRALDEMSNYKAPRSSADVNVDVRNERAKLAADVLRRRINDLDPGIINANDEMADALRLRQIIQERSRAPIAAVSPGKSTDAAAELLKLDRLSGSDVGGLRDSIGRAKQVMLDPRRYTKDLQALDETRRLLERIVVESSPLTAPAAQQGTGPGIQALLELLRQGRTD